MSGFFDFINQIKKDLEEKAPIPEKAPPTTPEKLSKSLNEEKVKP